MAKQQDAADVGKPIDAPFTNPDDKNGNVEFGRRATKKPRRRTRHASRQQPKAK